MHSKIIDVSKTCIRFKRMREEHSISVRDLSLAMKGVPLKLIIDIENGVYIPTLEYVFDFCEYFSVSIDEIVISKL